MTLILESWSANCPLMKSAPASRGRSPSPSVMTLGSELVDLVYLTAMSDHPPVLAPMSRTRSPSLNSLKRWCISSSDTEFLLLNSR